MTSRAGLPQPALGHELPPELAEVPGHLLWRAAARVTSCLEAALPAGMDIHAYAALLALATGEPRSQQSLATTIWVSRTTMVKVAAGLAEQGLAARVRNPHDRRSYALTRTTKGAAAVRRWRRHAEQLETALTAGLSAAECAELRELLRIVVAPELAPDTPDALLDSLGFLVTRAHAHLHRTFSAELAPLGILPPHVGVLTTLTAAGSVPQTELGRRLGVSAASVVQFVDDLEDRGLLERGRLAGDRRIQVLNVLPEGTRVLRRARRIGAVTLAERLGGMTVRRRRRLVLLLNRFLAAPLP